MQYFVRYMTQLFLMINIQASSIISAEKNISKFRKYLTYEAWANIYYSGTQEAFTEFQEIINTHFDKSFKKEVFTLTYKNCYQWMTNSLRNKITEKN